MLRRIRTIKNIGRFVDCAAAGLQFEKETIIFGFNTEGKSTLTAILRSIQTGNNDLLIGRKTFGVPGSKKVEIDFENNGETEPYIFQNKAWNKSNPNILIFDSKFIAENIFDGENINFDHQKNLNAIIIGKKGRDLNQEIISLKEQSDNFAAQKTEKTRELIKHFPDYTPVTFKALREDSNIDGKIADKDKEIKFELDKENIQKAVKGHIATLTNIPFGTKVVLSKTLDLKQDEIEEHIKSHFSTTENAQDFLSEGLNFLKPKPEDGESQTCVFCGQQLNAQAEALIRLYSEFFKGGYQDLQNEIDNAIEDFKSINIEAILERISADLMARGLDINLNREKINELLEKKEQFEKELLKKRDLNHALNFDSFDALQKEIEKIRLNLINLENTRLTTPSSKTIAVLKKERLALEVIKQRYERKWVDFCDECAAIESSAEDVRRRRDEKRKELDEYSLEIFNTHKETINRLCREMGADFEIEDFKPMKKIVGKSERIFAIKFFGSHKVDIDNEDEKTPNFRNTLSESDKRLLAFAFFLSLLAHDKNVNSKIVVFDDPVSSFDSERRRKTIHLIADISCSYKEADGSKRVIAPAQKIILTHEDRFAKELLRIIPTASTFRIKGYKAEDSEQKLSNLIRGNFGEEFPDDLISHKIERIKKILDTHSFQEEFELDCREVLEHIFKRKYCIELKTEIALKKSVRTFVDKLSEAKISGFDEPSKLQIFKRLCDDLNIELHEGSVPNSNGDKQSILNDFFTCLRMI